MWEGNFAASALLPSGAMATAATVITATPLSDDQAARVARGIAQRYGRDITVNRVVDPSVIGGVRVQVGGDVIDGTVATRLADLRLQLAG